LHRSTPRPSLSSPCQVRLISSRASLIIIIISTLFILTLLHPQPALAGTAAELTTPPVTGAPAQASPKASAPLDQPDSAAKALAARRESTSIDNSLKAALEKPSAAAAQATAAAKEESAKLKEFVQDDRHFSLVRCASPPSHSPPSLYSTSLTTDRARRNFRLADCVTLGNGFCGALSLFSSAEYLRNNDQRFLWCVPSLPPLVHIAYARR